MILKARIKSFEEMPPYCKCCSDSIEAMRPFCGTEVLLNGTLVDVKDICNFCGRITEGKGFLYAFEYFSLQQDMIDIDEGTNESIN